MDHVFRRPIHTNVTGPALFGLWHSVALVYMSRPSHDALTGLFCYTHAAVYLRGCAVCFEVYAATVSRHDLLVSAHPTGCNPRTAPCWTGPSLAGRQTTSP